MPAATVMEIEIGVTAELGRMRPIGIRPGHHELQQKHAEPDNQRSEIDSAHGSDGTTRLGIGSLRSD